MEGSYIRIMCVLFYAAPKNHLLGKHTPFLLFLCLTNTLPKKDHEDQFCFPLLAPFLCVFVVHILMEVWGKDTGGHRIRELA